MNFDFSKLNVSIHGNEKVTASYDTGDILVGTVEGECSYDHFKAFLTRMNGLVAAHQKYMNEQEPKDAA